jgi:hypothetical protein
VTSLPYALQENELSKPEICDFYSLVVYSVEKSHVSGVVYLAHSLVVYRVEKSHVSGVVYLAHSLVVYRVEKSHVSGLLVTSLPYTLQENEVSKPETCHFSTLYTTRE